MRCELALIFSVGGLRDHHGFSARFSRLDDHRRNLSPPCFSTFGDGMLSHCLVLEVQGNRTYCHNKTSCAQELFLRAKSDTYTHAMMLTTCLWFNGNGRAAAEFYVRTFPNSSLTGNWVSEADGPGNSAGDEVVVNFEVFGMPFIALNGGPQFPHTPAVSFQIPCENQSEIDHYWEVLTSDGGEESQCGWLVDKFGISWQVVCKDMEKYLGGPSAAGSKAATEAMMEMRKIDLETMRIAYESAAS